jgi:quinol monooxygenase YgiN
LFQSLSSPLGTKLAYAWIVVQVILTMVVPPRRTTEMKQTLRSLMLPLPAAPGFILCRLYQEADDKNTICYMEEWDTPEDLDRQILSSHYTQLMTLIEAAAEPPELRLNWVADVKGLEYLEAVRLRDR